MPPLPTLSAAINPEGPGNILAQPIPSNTPESQS
jgi:hypothetical protein